MSSKGKRVKPKKQTEDILKVIILYIAEMATAIYSLCILCIYPLYYQEEKYGKMGAAKYDFFLKSSKIFLITLLVCVAFLFANWFIKKYGIGMLGIFTAIVAVLAFIFIGGNFSKSTAVQKAAIITLGIVIVGVALWAVILSKHFFRCMKICFNRYMDVIRLVIKDFSVTDWFAIGYLFFTIISYFLSSGIAVKGMYTDPNKTFNVAWNGYPGWNMGLQSQIIFVGIYFLVSRFWKWTPGILFAGLISAGIVYAIAIAMRFGNDPLEMYTKYKGWYAKGTYTYTQLHDVLEKFISTLGQTTWYSGYAMLILPIGMYWFWNDNVTWSRIISGIFVCLGAGSIVTVNSDSAYVAMAFIVIVFFWYSLESNDKFLRFLETMILMLASFKMVGVLKYISGLHPYKSEWYYGVVKSIKKTFKSYLVFVNDSAAISNFMMDSTIMLLLLIIVVVLYAMLKLVVKDNAERGLNDSNGGFSVNRFKVIRKIVVYGAVLGIWLVTLLIILTTRDKLPAPLQFLKNIPFFNFNDDWGNVRGFNWKISWMAIKDFGVKDLLVGAGPDCLAVATMPYRELVAIKYNQSDIALACAHNEFLNMFVTGGILGVVTYLGIMISQFRRLCKAAYNEPVAVAFAAIIVSYIGHNFFCYQTCLCTTFLFLFMGMAESVLRTLKKAENTV